MPGPEASAGEAPPGRLPPGVPHTPLLAHLAGAGLRSVTLDPPRRRTVIVSPHPDDESLAAGGLLARQASRQVELVVVAVTDGEAAFPDLSASDLPPSELASVRRGEQRRAVDLLGPGTVAIVRLGLPDGRVAAHERRLVRLLTALIRPGDLVVAPWPWDRHPDHEACGRAAAVAAGAAGTGLWESLFWAHQHCGPVPPRRRLGVLRLTGGEQRKRQAAIAAHASQMGGNGLPAVVAPRDVGHLALPCEVYLVAAGRPGPP